MRRRDLIKASLAMMGGLASNAMGREIAEEAGLAADDLTSAIRDEAEKLFEKNRVDSSIGLFHVPSIETYRSFFAWDSGWNAIALAGIDPDLAVRELETIFSVQAGDGHVPHEVRVPEMSETDPIRKVTIAAVRKQYDENGRSHFIDPPSFLIAAGLLWERTGDIRILGLLPAIDRTIEYLTGPRDLFGDGLISIIHPWESGTDSAPVFDKPTGINMKNPFAPLDYLVTWPGLLNHCARLDWDLGRIAASNKFVMEEVGLNAIASVGIAEAGKLHAAAASSLERNKVGDIGRHQRLAVKYEDLSKQMMAAMDEIFWDDDRGYYFPRYDLERPKQSKRVCLTGLLPLMNKYCEKGRAARVIEEYLMSPDHFHGDWMVPFNSASEMAAEKVPFEDLVLWRGHCIWINMNWMAARAASVHGREDISREITMKTLTLIRRSGFREFYDPRTGEGGGAKGFTWPGLALDMIEEYGM